METLNELFEHTLQDIYYAENAILKALPKMAKQASSEELAAAFEEHYEQTQGQVKRLEEVFELIGSKAKGTKCPAIEGIIKEAEELMKEVTDDTVRDAAMLAAAQAVEHYEISRYGTLVAWAEKLGYEDAADLLDETLAEEIETDETLSDLAESEINVDANQDDETDEDEDEDDQTSSKGRAA